MKKLFGIAALFAALGLAAAFCGCSNSGDTPVFITAPVDSTAGETSGTNDTGSGGAETPVTTPTPSPTTTMQTTTTYTINFDANDGSQNPAKATQIFTAGVPQKLTPVAELGFKRDNFNFAGWALSSAASQAAYVDGAEYTGDISVTLYAVWTNIIYTVTFDYNNGSETRTQSVASGQTATKPDDPTKDHFNFAGWCSDENCQTPFDFATPITENTTLYAKWSDRPVYIVTFELNGGKYGSSDTYTQNVEEGAKAMCPASAPTKDDKLGAGVTTKYAFDNWYADADCNDLFDFDATTITGPTTIYAKWNETKIYTVTFDLNDGKYDTSDIYTQNVEAGSKVTRPAGAPTKDDKVNDGVTTKYTFVNWYADAGCGTLFNFDATNISGPTTIYAKWSETNTYVVTFDLGGGKYDSSDTYTQNVKAGYKASRPASAPTKDDAVSGGVTTKYTFVNWYTDASCGTLFNFDATSITGPKTIYAKWTETKYYSITIVNNSEHGSFSSNITEPVVEGTLVTLTASPNPGYKFSSYAVTDANSKTMYVLDGKFEMPASPVIVKATFLAIKYTITCGTPKNGTLTSEVNKATIGTTVTLTVSARVGYEFRKILVKNSKGKNVSVTEVVEGASYSFTMPADNVTVTATFGLPGMNVPLTFEAYMTGDTNVTFSNKAAGPIKYRVNGGGLQTIASHTYASITLTAGDKVCFFGDNETYYDDSRGEHSYFSCSDCYVYGNIMSLVDSANYENATTLTKPKTFYGLFKISNARFINNIRFKEGMDLLLPATELTESCYEDMFTDCPKITRAPALPAKTLAESCYSRMFIYCDSLVIAPTLPAEKLAKNCYAYMFSDCDNLRSAPELPATELAESCYKGMFYGCYMFEDAPVLPATYLANSCYEGMFYGCSNLESVTCLAKYPSENYTAHWLYGVVSTGTFKRPSGVSWPRGENGIPDGWTVVNY